MQQESLIRWVQALLQIGQSLTHESVESARQHLVEHIVAGFKAASGSIALLNPDQLHLTLAIATGSAAQFIGSQIAIGDGVLGWVVQERQSLMLNGDISHDARFKNLKLRRNPDRPVSALCWPLVVENQVIGALSINRGPDQPPFTEQDVADGAVMASLASLMVDNLRVHDVERSRTQELALLNEVLRRGQEELSAQHRARLFSEARLSAILEATPGAIVVVDDAQRIVVFNKGAEQIFGHDVAQMLGQSLEQLLPPRVATEHQQYIERFAGGATLSRNMAGRGEVVGRRSNGEEFPAAASIARVEVDGQRFFIAILSDLTEKKAREQALSDALRDRQNIMDSLQDVIVKVDAVGCIVAWNQSVERVTGFSADELRGAPAAFIVPEQDHPKVAAAIQHAVRDGRSEVEVYLKRKAGAPVLYRWITTPMKDAHGVVIGVTTLGRDITAAKQLEAALLKEKEEQNLLIQKLQEAQGQLLQSEKMASVGQLAAGVAHEINNPVGYVFSNLGTLQKYLGGLLQIIQSYEQNIEPLLAADTAALQTLNALKTQTDLSFVRDDAQGLMKETMEGLVRVKKIVQDLKDFSHVDKAEWQWADLHKGLDSTLNIVNNEIKYKATVVKEYGILPEVECIASQINQVFMNMLVNAAHAIEERGSITVRTGVEGEQVWVEIADSGKGIAPEHLQKIFEPFFTTKPVGKGTGLGLSLAYGIVNKHGGRIEVRSDVGKGTAFTVRLPMRQAQARADT